MRYTEIKLRRIDKLDIIDSLLGYLENLANLIIQLEEKKEDPKVIECYTDYYTMIGFFGSYYDIETGELSSEDCSYINGRADLRVHPSKVVEEMLEILEKELAYREHLVKSLEKKERKLLKKEKRFFKELEKPEEERDYGILDAKLALKVDILTEDLHNVDNFISQLMKLRIMLDVESEDLF